MQLTPREIEKLMVYTLADVALKRKKQGSKTEPPGSGCHYYDHGDGGCPGRKNPGSGDE